MAKRLQKSNSNSVISGVCGGIAEYFNIDPTIVRLGWMIFTFAGGSGLIAYIIAAVVMPTAPVYDPHMHMHTPPHGHGYTDTTHGNMHTPPNQDYGNGPRQQ